MSNRQWVKNFCASEKLERISAAKFLSLTKSRRKIGITKSYRLRRADYCSKSGDFAQRGKFSFVGMTGNILLDLYDDDYKMVTFRVLKYGVTFGAGKALDRVPGFKMMLQKPLWEANIQLWEKVISPIFEPKPKVQNIRK